MGKGKRSTVWLSSLCVSFRITIDKKKKLFPLRLSRQSRAQPQKSEPGKLLVVGVVLWSPPTSWGPLHVPSTTNDLLTTLRSPSNEDAAVQLSGPPRCFPTCALTTDSTGTEMRSADPEGSRRLYFCLCFMEAVWLGKQKWLTSETTLSSHCYLPLRVLFPSSQFCCKLFLAAPLWPS